MAAARALRVPASAATQLAAASRSFGDGGGGGSGADLEKGDLSGTKGAEEGESPQASDGRPQASAAAGVPQLAAAAGEGGWRPRPAWRPYVEQAAALLAMYSTVPVWAAVVRGTAAGARGLPGALRSWQAFKQGACSGGAGRRGWVGARARLLAWSPGALPPPLPTPHCSLAQPGQLLRHPRVPLPRIVPRSLAQPGQPLCLQAVAGGQPGGAGGRDGHLEGARAPDAAAAGGCGLLAGTGRASAGLRDAASPCRPSPDANPQRPHTALPARAHSIPPASPPQRPYTAEEGGTGSQLRSLAPPTPTTYPHTSAVTPFPPRSAPTPPGRLASAASCGSWTASGASTRSGSPPTSGWPPSSRCSSTCARQPPALARLRRCRFALLAQPTPSGATPPPPPPQSQPPPPRTLAGGGVVAAGRDPPVCHRRGRPAGPGRRLQRRAHEQR